MFSFKQSEAYIEAFGSDTAAVVGQSAKQAQILEPETITGSKQKTKKQTKEQTKKQTNTNTTLITYNFSYPRAFNVVRQLISFLLLLSVLPYSLFFEIRIFWWNYAAIPEGLRQSTWGHVENSIIGGLVKFAETGGARRVGEDLYTTGDLLRLLTHWVLVLALILFLYGLGNDVKLTSEHLQVKYSGKWRSIRWEQVKLIRTVELGSERLVVLIQINGWGLTIIHRLYSLLLGAGLSKGFIITSDIKDFDNLVEYLVYFKTQKLNLKPEQTADLKNPAELFVEDGFISPVLQGVLNPTELIENSIEAMPVKLKNAPHWFTRSERTELLPKMTTVALVVPVLYLVGAILNWSNLNVWTLVGAVLLFGLGLLEWIFISYLTFECGRQFALVGGWGNALLAYPHLQGTRILAGVAALVLTIVFAPGWIIFSLIAAACIWCALLTTVFTARLYDFPIQKAALTGVGVILYQGAFLAFYLLLK